METFDAISLVVISLGAFLLPLFANKIKIPGIVLEIAYGILVGPSSSQAQLDRYSKLIEAEPENYVAQPTLSLSTGQTVVDSHYEPRHMDLRPFILSGKDTWVTSGGLTRVALTKGSLVVNSSQGGGSKDTWILDPQE